MALNLIFKDNGISNLPVPISAIQTSIPLATGTGVLFPNPTGGQYFYLTLADFNTNGQVSYELVKVTTRVGDLCSVCVRGQGGTNPTAFNPGDRAELRWDAQSIADFAAAVVVGAPTTLSYLTAANETATLPNSRRIANTSSINLVDGGAGSTITAIVNTAGVVNAMLANFNANTILGNNTGSAAAPVYLTGAQTALMFSLTTFFGTGVTSAAWGYGTHAARPVFGTVGRFYFETDTSAAFYDTGAAWLPWAAAFGYLLASNNLSDLTNTATARTNLGLGTAATQASGFFLQVGNNLSDLSSATVGLNNLSYLNPGTSAVARGLNLKLSDMLSVKDFGAVGNGTTDDTAAFNAAIAAAAANALTPTGTSNGTIVFVPTGKYKITSTLQIGNATSSTTSTYSGVCLIGQAVGAGPDEIATSDGPSQLIWAGANNIPVVQINGPVAGVRVENIHIVCSGVTGSVGLDVLHAIGSSFRNIIVEQYGAVAYRVQARAGTWTIGCSRNYFENCSSSSPPNASGASGLQLGQLSPGATDLDVLRNTFVGCLFTGDGSTATSAGAVIATCDHCYFYGCIFTYEGGALSKGIVVSVPATQTTLPQGVWFYGCAVIAGVGTTGAAWTGVYGTQAGLGFFPYPTADGEPLPPQSPAGLFYGFTDTNITFGQNLIINGTGRLFQADFSNATIANRAVFQSSTLNGNTVIYAAPNGAGVTSQFVAANIFPVTNASALVMQASSAVPYTALISTAFGTGTTLPLAIQIKGLSNVAGNANAALIDINGNAYRYFAEVEAGYAYSVQVAGFSYTVPNNVSQVLFDPAATLATGTVTFPSTPVDGQLLTVSTSHTITVLTWTPNVGQSVVGSANSLTVGTTTPPSQKFLYKASNTTWYRIG